MGLVVNTNVASLGAQRSLFNATNSLNGSMQKLSTGMRINKASDDAAGLSISEGLKSQFRGADVAQANALDAINMLSVAEGDLGVMQDNLQRVRDLTVQAANDTNSTAERDAIDAEITARLGEIDRLSDSSEFNGKKLLDGTASATTTFQIGANSTSDNQIQVDMSGNCDSATLGVTTAAGSRVDSATNAASFLDEVDTAIEAVSTKRGTLGSIQNRLDSTVQSLSITSENLQAANSRIRDVDIAKESGTMVKSQILQQASASLLAQANQAPGIATSLI